MFAFNESNLTKDVANKSHAHKDFFKTVPCLFLSKQKKKKLLVNLLLDSEDYV